MRPFVIRRPNSLDEAQDAARERPQDGALRAGGIDLLDRMKEVIDAPA